MRQPRRRGNRTGIAGLGLWLVIVPIAVQAQPFTGTALVRRAPTLNGSVEGSIRQMLADDVTLNGGASVTGDLLVPGTPTVRLNGSPAYGGTLDGTGSAAPAGYTVTLNGNAALRHVIRRTDAIALPAVAAPPPPTGTRSVSLNNASQAPGDFATLRNLTLNGKAGTIAVPPGTYGDFKANAGSGFVLGIAGATVPAMYNFQNLTLNGSSTFSVVGPVVVTVDDGFSVNGTMGSPDHPEWLHLRLAEDGLTVNGNRVIYAHLEAPDGAVTLNGSARLVGAVTADRLIINGDSLLQLAAPAAPDSNRPPEIALTSPTSGTSYTPSTAIALAAAASDSDGTVAKVEFFSGATNLGEDSTSPYELSWTPPGSGVYVLTAKATDNAGAVTTSDTVTITVEDNGVPFLANFEPAEGYQAGPLHGQKGWNVLGDAEVVSAPVYFGQQAVSVAPGTPPALLARTFANADPGITFVDLFVQPAAGATPAEGVFFETDATRVALTGTAPAGILQAFNGDGAGGGIWSTTGNGPALDADGRATDWLRLTTRSDYATKKWDLYFNGRMIAADLGFVNNTQAAFTGLGLSGHTTLTTGFDDLLVAFENPVFVDADHDGMDDAWETVHGLNTALNDRNGDHDADGLTNIIEYVLGGDPNNPDTDGDGMRDGWEYQHGLKPLVNDATSDLDADGMTNLIEFKQGRNPTKGAVPDTTGVISLRVYQPSQ